MPKWNLLRSSLVRDCCRGTRCQLQRTNAMHRPTAGHACRAAAAFGPWRAMRARSSWMCMSTAPPLACMRRAAGERPCLSSAQDVGCAVHALKADRCLFRWARSLSRQPALTTMYRLSFVTCAAVSAGRAHQGFLRSLRSRGATHLGDNCVVDDAALLVGDDGQGARVVRQASYVTDHQLLNELDGVLALRECQGSVTTSSQGSPSCAAARCSAQAARRPGWHSP